MRSPLTLTRGATLTPTVRWTAMALMWALGASMAWGQTNLQNPGSGNTINPALLQISEQSNDLPDDRRLPRMERAHFEDDGSTIDEVRIGGETRSVTVQPKANMPAYEIRPTNGARRAHTVDANGSPRVWNLLNF